MGRTAELPLPLSSSGDAPEEFTAEFTPESPLAFDVRPAKGLLPPAAAAAAAAGEGPAGGGGAAPITVLYTCRLVGAGTTHNAGVVDGRAALEALCCCAVWRARAPREMAATAPLPRPGHCWLGPLPLEEFLCCAPRAPTPHAASPQDFSAHASAPRTRPPNRRQGDGARAQGAPGGAHGERPAARIRRPRPHARVRAARPPRAAQHDRLRPGRRRRRRRRQRARRGGERAGGRWRHGAGGGGGAAAARGPPVAALQRV